MEEKIDTFDSPVLLAKFEHLFINKKFTYESKIRKREKQRGLLLSILSIVNYATVLFL